MRPAAHLSEATVGTRTLRAGNKPSKTSRLASQVTDITFSLPGTRSVQTY